MTNTDAQSSTTFVLHIGGRNETPTAAKPFCGHGVLAAAKTLHDKYNLTSISFRTFTRIDITAFILPNPNSTPSLRLSMRVPSTSILSRPPLSNESCLAFGTAPNLDVGIIACVGRTR